MNTIVPWYDRTSTSRYYIFNYITIRIRLGKSGKIADGGSNTGFGVKYRFFGSRKKIKQQLFLGYFCCRDRRKNAYLPIKGVNSKTEVTRLKVFFRSIKWYIRNWCPFYIYF